MLAQIKAYTWAFIAIVIGALSLFLGIQTQRNKRLKDEVNGAKKDAQKASEQLETVNDAVKKAEDKRQEVLKTEATIDNIKKETAEAVKTAKEIRKTDTITFGKWAVIFAVLMLGSGCATTLSECRSKYPCPENVCLHVTPPKLDTLPRPDLVELAVRYDEKAKGFVFTPEQIGSLLGNERSLIETIRGYEKIIDAYNAWRLKK